jgi:hypothetical protein
MDLLDWLLLATPIGVCTLGGLLAAYVMCKYFPPSEDCSTLGALLVAAGFVVGLILTVPRFKNKR